MAGRGGLAYRIRLYCHPALGPKAVLRARVDFVHQLRQRGNQVAVLGRLRGSALILNSCVAAGSLELGMSYSPLSILQAQPGRAVGQPGPGLRLGRITPHGVQARATRHVGRPVKPLVAQALVKPCAIAIAGLQIGGQALAV